MEGRLGCCWVLRDCLSFFLGRGLVAVDGVRVCDDNIEPNIFFHLLDDVCELLGANRLNRRVILCKGLEE